EHETLGSLRLRLLARELRFWPRHPAAEPLTDEIQRARLEVRHVEELRQDEVPVRVDEGHPIDADVEDADAHGGEDQSISQRALWRHEQRRVDGSGRAQQ